MHKGNWEGRMQENYNYQEGGTEQTVGTMG